MRNSVDCLIFLSALEREREEKRGKFLKIKKGIIMEKEEHNNKEELIVNKEIKQINNK